MTIRTCPALFLAAPASGQGKTTITAALATLFTRQGKVVRVFKTGPDYLDPQILHLASGHAVEQLDLWMAGEQFCQQKLFEAAQFADLILVEGVMGMFDGEPSSADLASRFNIPMAIVMDVKGMAQTAAAIATGLANYRDDVAVIGLIANNCGTERHAQLIRDALPPSLPLLGSLARSESVALPERHLGLVQANEIQAELTARFNAGADWMEEAGFNQLLSVIPSVDFKPVKSPETPKVQVTNNNIHLAIAKDSAFSFIYDANLQLLDDIGLSYSFFSPLTDKVMPKADALWLPGGYPELYAEQLAQNSSMLASIRDFHGLNKPILAECGGFLYCLELLRDLNEQTFELLGLIQGAGEMRGKRGCQGMQTLPLPEGDIRGHAHHRSRSHGTPEPIAWGRRQRHTAPGEPIYRKGRLTASYLHWYFPSNPQAVAEIFCPSDCVIDRNVK